jgi:uncharacterized RDD family membrane protein YckC
LSAPDKLTIETPEQISLEYALASAGSRFLALAIDTVLQFAVIAVLWVIAVFALALRVATVEAAGTWVIAGIVLAASAILYGYFAVFEALWNGQTPGKRAVGVRVITLSGRPIGPMDSILRNLLRIVDQIPGIYAVGIVSVFLTERNQRLGDLAAGTVVVHEQPLRHQQPAVTVVAGAPRLGAHRLQPNEVEAMEVFLKRRQELPTWMRDRTARDLARHLRARLDIPLERQPANETLLEELVAEFRARGR